MKSKKLLISIGIVLIFLGLIYWTSINRNDVSVSDNLTSGYTTRIKIGGKDLLVEVADTIEEREKGLSGRPELLEGYGMLFVFPTESVVTFWMPDMNFPIDIIFIRDNKVIYIEKNAPNFPAGTPLSDLPKYNSSEPVDVVLEVPAGWAERNGVGVGDLLED